MSATSPTRTVEGRVWGNMQQRCTNPNHPRYADYGGRGITVCERWSGQRGLHKFIKDMGFKPIGKTLDRVNNDKGYSKENCRWATEQEQQLNKRLYKSNTSGHRGIAWYKPYSKWRVQLKHNGVTKHGGYFDNLEDAVIFNNNLRRRFK
jgi:hypothetical protein